MKEPSDVFHIDASFLISEVVSPDRKRSLSAKNRISELTPATDVDITVFISALESPNHDVVFRAEIALSHLGERASAAIPRLVLLAKHDVLFLRQQAVTTLARIGASDAESRRAVFDAFDDEMAFVRREALQACIDLPSLSSEKWLRIESMARDPDADVARWSRVALRNIRLAEAKKGSQ